MKHLLFIFLLPLLINASCKKTVTPPPPPVTEQLPPATQEGKHTFGCLINGNVWVPYKTDFSRKLEVWYDPYYHLGTLRIIAERRKGTIDESITIATDTLSSIGSYSLADKKGRLSFYNNTKQCIYNDFENDVTKTGTLIITKLDLQRGIISGTFEFTLMKPGCDTIKATQGRFDIKL